MNINYVGEGKVVLLSGGGKCFTDIAARFVGSEKSLDEIIASPYDKNIVKHILSSGHLACTEFDNFIFGIEGYSRVTEIQLVRKRLASYMIKSGRINKHGKRSFDIVLPQNISLLNYTIEYNHQEFNAYDILHLIESWYNHGVQLGLPEEELRYLKPMGTEFKCIFSMNSHALLDWFKIRCCKNCMTETRDLANKMLKLCKETFPDLFEKAGASCISLGYCPENNRQHSDCKGKIFTHSDTFNIITQYKHHLIHQQQEE